MKPLRIGSVPFLNERPLTIALDARRDVALSHAPPAALALALAAGRLDAALLPVVEALRLRCAPLAPFGIACRGTVRSVGLWHDGPLTALRTIRVPAGSRSSVALLRLLLSHWGAGAATLVPTEFPADLAEPPPGASLLFGDVALRCAASPRPVVDLGAAWHDWTGLPFVFARWVGPPGRHADARLVNLLAAAATAGLTRRPAIADREAPARGLPLPLVRAYLTRDILFALGPAEESGQAEFARRAAAAGIL